MREVSRPVTLVMLGVIGVASIGISLKSSHDQGRTNDCLVTFIAENSRVSKLRAAANLKREQAVTDVLDGVAKLTLTPRSDDPAKAERQAKAASATYRQLLTDYQRKTAEVAVERAKNPLPDVPENCRSVS